MNIRRARIIAASIVVTFVAFRAMLHASPNSDFDVGGYNIHHLFTGLLLIVAGGLPLALFPGGSRLIDAAAIVFGIGLSLALDEWVYLIATDGSNASYLVPVSFWGGVIVVGGALLYTALLIWRGARGRDE